MDLVLIELGVNDWSPTAAVSKNMEALLRAVLALPNRPAVILAQSVVIAFPALATGADMHLSVAQSLDVEVIALRNWLLPALLQDPTLKRSP